MYCSSENYDLVKTYIHYFTKIHVLGFIIFWSFKFLDFNPIKIYLPLRENGNLPPGFGLNVPWIYLHPITVKKQRFWW